MSRRSEPGLFPSAAICVVDTSLMIKLKFAIKIDDQCAAPREAPVGDATTKHTRLCRII